MDGTSLRRKRVAIACEHCRKGKRKCDGRKPTCSLCQLTSRSCVYMTERSRKRSRVEDLEAEISRLRTIVNDLRHQGPESEGDRSPKTRDGGSSENSPISQCDADSSSSSPAIEGIDSASPAARELGSLSWDTTETDSGQSVFYGPTGLFSTPALADFRRKTGSTDAGAQTHRLHPSVVKDALLYEGFRVGLIDAFEQHVNSHNRFVDAETLDALRKTGSVPPDVQLLYAAILAFGAAVSEDAHVREMSGVLVESAQCIALSSCQHYADARVVQALSILAWLELGRGNNTSGWIFSSLAGSMVLHQGLHVQETPTGINPDGTRRAPAGGSPERIRTFWSFFWVNRFAAAALGRSTLIPWQQVRVPPLRSLFPPPTHMGLEDACLDALCALWSLHDRHMDRILSFDFPALDAPRKDALLRDARLALAQFYDSADERLRLAASSACAAGGMTRSAFYFQASYQVALILLHRPFLSESCSESCFASALHALAVAASAITDLLRRFRRQQHGGGSGFANVPPFMVYHILRAATVHLLLATARHTRRERRSDSGIGMSDSSSSSSSSSGRRSNGFDSGGSGGSGGGGGARCVAGMSWPAAQLRVCLEALEECQHTWPERGRQAVRVVQELAARWGVVRALPLRWSYPVVISGGCGDGKGGGGYEGLVDLGCADGGAGAPASLVSSATSLDQAVLDDFVPGVLHMESCSVGW